MSEYDREITVRLTRIEGQVRGIEAMVGQQRECEDIITQLSAVSSALTNVARMVLEHHIEHCVVDGIREKNESETVENLKKAISTFAKMK